MALPCGRCGRDIGQSGQALVTNAPQGMEKGWCYECIEAVNKGAPVFLPGKSINAEGNILYSLPKSNIKSSDITAPSLTKGQIIIGLIVVISIVAAIFIFFLIRNILHGSLMAAIIYSSLFCVLFMGFMSNIKTSDERRKYRDDLTFQACGILYITFHGLFFLILKIHILLAFLLPIIPISALWGGKIFISWIDRQLRMKIKNKNRKIGVRSKYKT